MRSRSVPNESNAPKWPAGFGPFRLSPPERLLEREGIPIRLGGRALDLLIALVDQAGETVSKRDLLQRVWPDMVVEEGSLRFHMVAVRKALSEGEGGRQYIANVVGRGYAFIADVRFGDQDARETLAPVQLPHSSSLPAMGASLVGRDEAVDALLHTLLQHRFVSIVGPGGIGKTSVGVASARTAAAKFSGDVAFVDFSGIVDPALVCSAIARVLGVSLQAAEEHQNLLAFLEHRRMLLVLDCCEHVVGAAAAIAEHIHARAPGVHLLATSREPLRAAGEYVYRLPPLAVPPSPDAITAKEALGYPAVRLFVDRAAAAVAGFQLNDAEAPLVARLCRELDGIALAIELAVGRLEAFGIREITEHLDQRMKLMWQGRRTAVPRQQTMVATLDWSHNLLAESERAVLRRLAVFSSGFSLEAAGAVASIDCTPAEVLEDIASLVSKSLVNVDAGGLQLRYKLLDTTRAYSRGKLADSGELDTACSRHAGFFAEWLRHSGSERDADDGERVMAELDELRAAIAWCLSQTHDLATAARLGAWMCPALLRGSLLAECRRWALGILEVMPAEFVGTQEEMLIQGALGQALMYTEGSTSAAESAFRRSMDIASTQDTPYQLSLLNGYGVHLSRGGQFAAALDVARQSEAIVQGLADPVAKSIVNSVLGTALHFVGENDLAMQHWERCIAAGHACEPATRARIGFDHFVCALCGRAQGLWLAGKYGEAVNAAADAIELAKAIHHPPTYCIALVWAGAIFLWRGDASRVEHTIAELKATATEHSFAPYLALAAGLHGLLQISRGMPAEGVNALREALDALHRTKYAIRTTMLMTALADGLRELSRFDEGFKVCEETIARIEHQGDYLHMPEALVVQGRVLFALGRPHEAQVVLQRALDLGISQSSQTARLYAAIAMHELHETFGVAFESKRELQEMLKDFSAEESVLLSHARAMAG